MSDHNQQSKKSIEELLAAYADQIQLSHDSGAVPQSDDHELKELQETVLLLNQDIPAAPQEVSAAAIRTAVLKAWENQYLPKPTLAERISSLLPRAEKPRYQSRTRRRQIMAVRVTTAAVLVIIAAFIILPAVGISDGSTSGTALGKFGPWGLLGGLLLFTGLGLWWWFTSRRK
jgi:hypothetical protein